MNALNEALDKILKPEQEVAEKKQPVDKKLEKVLKESVSQVNLKPCKNNHDITVAYQRALQEAIEKVNPDKCWHEITGCDIYATLLECKNDTDAVISRILTESKVQPKQATNVSTNTKKTLNEDKSVAKKQGKKSLKEGRADDLRAMISGKVDRDRVVADEKTARENQEREEYINKIRQLKPRIEDAVSVGQFAMDNGISLEGNRWGYGSYDTNLFLTDGISHLVGLWNKYPQRLNKILGMGIRNGGANGDVDLFTDGDVVIGPIDGDLNKTKEPRLKDLKKFVDKFDEFETKFYDYIEKVCGNSTKVESLKKSKNVGKKSLNEGTAGDRWKLGGGFSQELDSFILKKAQEANAPAMSVKGFFDNTSFTDGNFDVDTYVDEDNKLIADRIDGETGEVVAHCEYPGFGDRKLLELEEILRGRNKNTRYKEDEIIIDRNEDGVIGKMHDLRSRGYESSGAGDGSIIFTKWKTESCKGKNCGKVVKSRKNIKESLSYGEMVAISDEWDKFKKKKGDNSPNTAWEFIETECKGVYDTEDEKWDVFAYIGSIEDVDEVVDLTNESKCGKRSRKVVKESRGNGKFEVLYTYYDGDADIKKFDDKDEAIKCATERAKEDGGYAEVREITGKDSYRVVKVVNRHLGEALKKKMICKRVQESLKKANKKPLKESAYSDGEDAFWDLVERTKLCIDDGYDSLDDAIYRALDDGLIYTDDIVGLATKYGVIDGAELIDRFVDELFNDIYAEVEDYWEDAHSEEENESLKKSRSKHSFRKGLKESAREGRFELDVWVPGSGGDDDRERTIGYFDDMEELLDTADGIDLDSDEAFYLSDWRGEFHDLDQVYSAEDLRDQVDRYWSGSYGIGKLQRDLGRMLLPPRGWNPAKRESLKRKSRESLKESTPKDLMNRLKYTSRFGKVKHNPAYSGAFDFEQSNAVEVTPEEVLAAKKRGENMDNYFILPIWGGVVRVNDAGGIRPDDSNAYGVRSNASLKKLLADAEKIYKYDVKTVGQTHPERFADPEERRANNRLGHARGTDHLDWDENPDEYKRSRRTNKKNPDDYWSKRAAHRYNNYTKAQADARYYASNKKLKEPLERLIDLKDQLEWAEDSIASKKGLLDTAKELGGSKYGQGSKISRIEALRNQIEDLKKTLADLEASYDAEKGQQEIAGLEQEVSIAEQRYADIQDQIDKLLRRKTESLRKSGKRKGLKESDEVCIFTQKPDDWYGVDFEDEVGEDILKETGIVICGNRDFREFGDNTLIDIIKGDYTDEDLWNEETGYYEDYDVLDELKKVTGKDYEDGEMRGYVQREWQDIYYPVGTDQSTLDWIENIYMGKYDGFVDEDNCLYVVPHDITWKGTEAIKKELADQSGYPADKIKIRKFTGYSRTPNYEDESLKEAKHDLYVNGDYVCSSSAYKRAKDFKQNVLNNRGVSYIGLDKDGKFGDVRKDITDTDKVVVKRDKSRNESLKESCSLKEESGCDQIEDEVKGLTKNFTKKDGTLTAWTKEQRDCARKVLRQHYKNVEISDGRMSADEEPSYVIAYSKPFDKNESLKESYYSQNDVLNMVSPKTKARLNKIITNQKQKYGNDMDIYVSIESPYRAYLSYGEGGADFVKNDNGVWEHDYGYIKIDSSLANAILSDVCKAAGMCDESLKESGNKNAFYVKPKKIDGLWRVVDVDDESKIKHAKRFEDEESCMKFIRKNARENNWVAGKEKEFKKTSDDKLTDLGKNVKKNIKDESICEDTVKQGNSWVNKGKEGTHGKFKTKKEADKQRAAMFANKKPGATWGK